jgi:hypothetical protein
VLTVNFRRLRFSLSVKSVIFAGENSPGESICVFATLEGDSMEIDAMALLKQHQPMNHKLDQLSEALFEMLEKLRESAHAIAEQEAHMEKRISVLEAGKA